MSPKKIVPPILVLAALGGGAWWYLQHRQKPADKGLGASGTVEATEAQLGFQVPGRIVALDAHEGDRVRAGQVIARLDPDESEARRAQTAAQVEAARAQLAELLAGSRREEIGQARAAFAAARDRETDARRDLERNDMLFRGGAVSREVLDKSRLAVQVAAAQRAQAGEQLKLVEAGPARERIDAARAQLAQAEAALRASDAALSNLTLTAPFDGVVTVRHREPGEIVGAGAPVVTIMDPADRWVRIYIQEDRLGAVRVGAPAAIRSDTYPGKSYPGQVSFIASEAEFTPKSVQTTEERVRLVYEVKVRITGDPEHQLKPGLPADVSLEEGGREGTQEEVRG
jgi:HlyD family secretion protein